MVYDILGDAIITQKYLDAVLEDVTRTCETTAFPVDEFFTKYNDLFKEENSAVVKLQLVCSGRTARLRN